MTKSTSDFSNRLSSLDILRGFDLFLLLFFQPVLVALGQKLDWPFMNAILYQFDHEVWEGFRFWDLIMPLFLFMTGAAMPFSLSKYMRGVDRKAVYKKIIRRVAVLFILGMVVQGNLLGFDSNHVYIYTNTLQAIAAGYLIASLILLHCTFKWQLIVTVLLLIIYWLPMTFCGDFTPEGNFAEKVDRIILGRFRDGVYWNEDGTWSFASWYTYTWVWSSLTFGVTVMLGAFAGQIIKKAKINQMEAVRKLVFIGLALIGVALLWSQQMPVVKRLWTCSMIFLSGGYCFLLMALFYYWIDVRGHSRGLNWLKIYGMNSITAYLLGEVVNFRCVAASFSYGLEQYMGIYYGVWLTFVNYLLVFFILRFMYKHQFFLKI